MCLLMHCRCAARARQASQSTPRSNSRLVFLMKPSLKVRERKLAGLGSRFSQSERSVPPAVTQVPPALPASSSTMVEASRLTWMTRGCRNTRLSLLTELRDGDGDGRLNPSTCSMFQSSTSILCNLDKNKYYYAFILFYVNSTHLLNFRPVKLFR